MCCVCVCVGGGGTGGGRKCDMWGTVWGVGSVICGVQCGVWGV